MPFLIPGRGNTVYDSKGNYRGTIVSGKPRCSLYTFSVDPNCPLGALKPGKANCGCSGTSNSNGCIPKTLSVCPANSTCTAFAYAPWASCTYQKSILF